MSKELTAIGWLIVKRKDPARSTTPGDLRGKWATTKPVLEPDEVAIRLRVAVPASVFGPRVEASIVVPESEVVRAEVDVVAGTEETER